MADSLTQSHWDEHVAWSVTAVRMKRTREGMRNLVLSSTVAGAALSTLAASVQSSPSRTAAGIAGAAALALVPFFNKYFLSAEKTSNWLRARSVSEGIKSE